MAKLQPLTERWIVGTQEEVCHGVVMKAIAAKHLHHFLDISCKEDADEIVHHQCSAFVEIVPIDV